MQLMRMTEDGPLQPTPLWHRADLEGPALVREFLRESRIVRKGLDGSLAKVSMQTISFPMLFACAFHATPHTAQKGSKCQVIGKASCF